LWRPGKRLLGRFSIIPLININSEVMGEYNIWAFLIIIDYLKIRRIMPGVAIS